MAILQGSSYRLPIEIRDASGEVFTNANVVGASFVIGDVRKSFEDVEFNGTSWVVPLTEEETFSLKGAVEWQARFILSSGDVLGTIPKSEYVYESIDKVVLGGREDVEQ